MNRIHKKQYNVLLSSFILRAFFGTIVVSSLFSCKGASKEELEEVEKKATEEVKAAKEETEKVKKELEAKITVLEGRAPAAITADNYTHIQAAVGLNAAGDLDNNAGMAKTVKDLEAFKSAIQGAVGLDANGNEDKEKGLASTVVALDDFMMRVAGVVGIDIDGKMDKEKGLAKTVAGLDDFMMKVAGVVGIDIDGNEDKKKGLAKDVEALKNYVAALRSFNQKLQTSVGLNAAGDLLDTDVGLAKDVEALKTFRQGVQPSLDASKNLAKEVAAMPDKIINCFSAFANQLPRVNGQAIPKVTKANLK
jgi:hypothetical protein